MRDDLKDELRKDVIGDVNEKYKAANPSHKMGVGPGVPTAAVSIILPYVLDLAKVAADYALARLGPVADDFVLANRDAIRQFVSEKTLEFVEHLAVVLEDQKAAHAKFAAAPPPAPAAAPAGPASAMNAAQLAGVAGTAPTPPTPPAP